MQLLAEVKHLALPQLTEKHFHTRGDDFPEEGAEASSLTGACSSQRLLCPSNREDSEQETLNTPHPDMELRCTRYPLQTVTRHTDHL